MAQWGKQAESGIRRWNWKDWGRPIDSKSVKWARDERALKESWTSSTHLSSISSINIIVLPMLAKTMLREIKFLEVRQTQHGKWLPQVSGGKSVKSRTYKNSVRDWIHMCQVCCLKIYIDWGLFRSGEAPPTASPGEAGSRGQKQKDRSVTWSCESLHRSSNVNVRLQANRLQVDAVSARNTRC